MKSEIFKTPLPYLALLAAHIIWGGNYVVAKIAVGEFPGMTLGFLRFALAAILIAPFLITVPAKERNIKLEHLPRLILAALFTTTINIAFFYQGLARTNAIDASVLELIIPILSVLGGWWFLKEKIYSINLMGILLALAGALSVIGIPLLLVGGFSMKQLFGDVLILFSASSFVIGAILLKNLLKVYHPLIITAFSFLVGAVAFLIPAIYEYIQNPGWVNQISLPLAGMGLLYIVVLSSICAFLLLMWGLSKIELSHANLFQYLEPAVAASLAVPLLGERISFSFIIGTCLIILGVYWGTLGRQQHHHAQHKHHRN